jgi:DNA-binding GntR family transcriptional regulator
MRDFKEGAATASYRASVDAAADIAAKKKKELPAELHSKIDWLLDRYAKKLAEWQNENYRIEAMCPSIMISGSSNFPVRKKEKQNSRRRSHMEAWEKVQDILESLENMTANIAIRSDDENAVEKIREKIAKLKEENNKKKKLSAYYRKHKTFTGCPDLKPENIEKFNESAKRNPFGFFQIQNNSSEIRRLEARIKELEAVKDAEIEDFYSKFLEGNVVFNKEDQRIQILFDSRPSECITKILKQNAFKWAPSKGAWQRLMTANAIRSTKNMCGRIPRSPTQQTGGAQ